jgi:hypothetical protein
MAERLHWVKNAPDAGELSRENWLGLLAGGEAASRESKHLTCLWWPQTSGLFKSVTKLI